MKKIIFVTHCSNQGHYYIGMFGEQFWDSMIAAELNLETQNYQRILIDKFNGFVHEHYESDVFFHNLSDAERALEWVNSVYLSVLLSESEMAE